MAWLSSRPLYRPTVATRLLAARDKRSWRIVAFAALAGMLIAPAVQGRALSPAMAAVRAAWRGLAHSGSKPGPNSSVGFAKR